MTEFFIICLLLIFLCTSKYPFSRLINFYRKLVDYERGQIGYGRNEKHNNKQNHPIHNH
jgi:hypothetical protein